MSLNPDIQKETESESLSVYYTRCNVNSMALLSILSCTATLAPFGLNVTETPA